MAGSAPHWRECQTAYPLAGDAHLNNPRWLRGLCRHQDGHGCPVGSRAGRDGTNTHPCLRGSCNSFDVVVSTQVLEHVKHPWRWIKEVYRICKPNGIIYICTPNSIGYHAFPIDCWRVWPEGMNAVFEEAGVIPLDVYAINGDTTGIGSKLVEIKFN